MHTKSPVLVTIKPSHYCEKARWALEYTGFEYSEDPHPPLLHRLATTPFKTGTVPLLITKDKVITDSTDILSFLDTQAPDNKKLYPEALKTEILELEELFDTKLGPHTRRIAYYYLLNYPQLVFPVFRTGLHQFEELVFENLFEVIKTLMQLSMKINYQGYSRSKEKVNEVFAEVESRLSDGRTYLTGEIFTAADITFASLAAPMVLPVEYWPAGLDILPHDLYDEISYYRNTKAGQWVLKIYSQKRN